MKILFLGDLLYDYEDIQEDIKELGNYFKQNNYYTILNLEAPLKSNTPIKKWINLYNSNKIIEVLKLLNVVAVCIANNHIMDWGKAGLENILRELDENNITYFGAGFDIEDALEPRVLYLNDRTIGLLGFGWDEEMCVYAQNRCSGVAPLDTNIVLNAIEHLKKSVDFVLVNFHWGYEYELYPLPIHRKLAQQAIDSGADLIIGHHPHIVQAYEIFREKHIFYSLGNFYFGSLRSDFNNSKNEIESRYSRYGLGVIFDIPTEDMNTISFVSLDNCTSVKDEIRLINLNNIKLDDYNIFFRKNRTSNRKPNLSIGRNSRLINAVKLKCCKFKEFIFSRLIITLKSIGVFNILKRLRDY